LPAYLHFDPDKALIKMSFSHPGQRVGDCRQLTPEEIAALAPNMRQALDCPRERNPVYVELELDGTLLYSASSAPSGLARDGLSTIYERFIVEPGRHTLVARLRDSARSEGYDYENEADVDISPQQNFVIDFRTDTGEFLFR